MCLSIRTVDEHGSVVSISATGRASATFHSLGVRTTTEAQLAAAATAIASRPLDDVRDVVLKARSTCRRVDVDYAGQLWRARVRP